MNNWNFADETGGGAATECEETEEAEGEQKNGVRG